VDSTLGRPAEDHQVMVVDGDDMNNIGKRRAFSPGTASQHHRIGADAEG
jgi:hypothetical protein